MTIGAHVTCYGAGVHLAITQDDDLSAMTDEELRESLQSFMAELLDEMGMPAEARAVRRKIGS